MPTRSSRRRRQDRQGCGAVVLIELPDDDADDRRADRLAVLGEELALALDVPFEGEVERERHAAALRSIIRIADAAISAIKIGQFMQCGR